MLDVGAIFSLAILGLLFADYPYSRNNIITGSGCTNRGRGICHYLLQLSH